MLLQMCLYLCNPYHTHEITYSVLHDWAFKHSCVCAFNHSHSCIHNHFCRIATHYSRLLMIDYVCALFQSCLHTWFFIDSCFYMTLKNQNHNHAITQIRRQRKPFFFIPAPSFRWVVASVCICLYLLIYRVLIIRFNFAAWNITGCSCRFLSVLQRTWIARQRVLFHPEGFGTERCPLRAKCIRILANSKMCCLHRKTSFAAYNLLLFQRGFSSPQSGKLDGTKCP